MARVYKFVIGRAEAGLRLDRYLVRRLPAAISRGMIQRGVLAGRVTVGELPVKAHHRLRAGEMITARFDELPAKSTNATLTPQPIPLEIVYEDAHLLVVNKPAGLVTHPAPGHWDGTLVNAILWHFQQAQHPSKMRSAECGVRSEHHSELRTPNSELRLPRAGIVHRLDKDTSGLLIVAKTEAAHVALSRQLKARQIKRQYLAVVEGLLPLDKGTVNAAIGRHRIHRKEMTVRHLGGRSAVTHFRVLKRYSAASCKLQATGYKSQAASSKPAAGSLKPAACSLEPGAFAYTLLEVSLETGRTHQIRVHMAHLGHPVMGDTTYGRHTAGFWQALGVSRQLLHAQAIHFQHPASGKLIELTAPVPHDLARWL